jgi:hypothetical protein
MALAMIHAPVYDKSDIMMDVLAFEKTWDMLCHGFNMPSIDDVEWVILTDTLNDHGLKYLPCQRT